MYECFICTYVCAHIEEVRRGWDPLEQESPCGCSEQVLGPLEEEPVYLTTELSPVHKSLRTDERTWSSAQLYLLQTEHHPIIPLCWYHRHHTPSQVHRCHFMNKQTRDGAEYHLRLKGKLDPRVGLLVRILAQPHSVPGHWWSLGGWLKNEKAGGLESSITPICALEPSKKGNQDSRKAPGPFRKCQPLEETLPLISNRYSSRLTWEER